MSTSQFNIEGKVLINLSTSLQDEVGFILTKGVDTETGIKQVSVAYAVEVLYENDEESEVTIEGINLLSVSDLEKVLKNEYPTDGYIMAEGNLVAYKSPEGKITLDDPIKFFDTFGASEIFKQTNTPDGDVETFLEGEVGTSDDIDRDFMLMAQYIAIEYGLNEQDHKQLRYLYKTLHNLILNY